MAKYEPKNLPQKSVGVINQIRQDTLTSAEAVIQELQYLLSAVKQYKSAATFSIDSNLEKADLLSKYKHSDPGGAYNLPGVMAGTTASYDLTAIKQDNARLSEIKEESERAEDESELYYKIVMQNANDLTRRLKKIASLNSSLKVYFQQLENYSDWQAK